VSTPNKRFPWCTAIAICCAALSYVAGIGVTIYELSRFAPGTHIRFVIGGFLFAALFVIFTIAWAVAGAFVEHRIGTSFVAVLIALTSLPASHYVFRYIVEMRHLVAEP
jgi:hypothetical protein